jgi:membrane protein
MSKKGRESLWKLGGLSWTALAKRVWAEMNRDDVFGDAAKLAYYFLLALFPLLIFLTSVIGLIIGSGSGMRHTLFAYLARVMPSSAFQLIQSTVLEVSNASGAGKLSFGLLAALWAASNGMGAITDALNRAYNVEERRAWWKQRAVAVALTTGLSLLILTALVLVMGGGKIADHLAATYGLSSFFLISWKVLQWPIALAFMLLAFALIYFFAPDVRDQDWKWITPDLRSGWRSGWPFRLLSKVICIFSIPTARRMALWGGDCVDALAVPHRSGSAHRRRGEFGN